MPRGWRGWNGLTHRQELWFKSRPILLIKAFYYPWIVAKQSTALHSYRHQSSVVCKEKLWWAFLASYNGIGDRHFAVVHLVIKSWMKSGLTSFFSLSHLHIWEVVLIRCAGLSVAVTYQISYIPHAGRSQEAENYIRVRSPGGFFHYSRH
jgi:hypothetical protein